MKEDLLHFLWGQNKLHGRQLTSTAKEALFVKAPGTLNQHDGPDFFNAQVVIGNQIWVGNVEIHVKSSDWYAHNHEKDTQYDNVILHVVWEDDVSVFRRDDTEIPTLELKNYIPDSLLNTYQHLFEKNNSKFINCEKHFAELDDFLLAQWYDRLYVERLEQKSTAILNLLQQTKNDWEAVLFILLAKNFGSKVNGEFFMSRAQKLDFSIIRKTRHDLFTLESLLFGFFGLLEDSDCLDTYYQELLREYNYLSKKFELPSIFQTPKFYGLRPPNFPTIRISQLANLYYKCEGLFGNLMDAVTIKDLYNLLKTATSTYWQNHYTFGKPSKISTKNTPKTFLDILIINTVIPIKFCHNQHLGREKSDQLISWVQKLKPEKNSIISGYDDLHVSAKNALESQAQLQLYTKYCTQNKCLQCAVGAHLLNRNT